MIARYSRKEMTKIWSTENKFSKMLEVEIAVAKVQAKYKIIPEKAARDISAKAKFKVSRVEEIEQTTKHDVIAFVSNLAENVGENGKYIHYGLTSSDVLDTALSLLFKDASQEIQKSIDGLKKALQSQIKKHAATLCAGRTHGMHAEVTSFGLKLSGFLAELLRNEKRFQSAIEQSLIGKLSGAVGTYSGVSAKLEAEVCEKLGLTPETIATQVIPRDRHAEVMISLAMIGNGLERLAVELRHLQRTEVSEVFESFSKGQKGSSAMPHKKNPISAENVTGLSRLLRSYAQASLENVALWHERDISHSSVERVILPDAFIVCDYALSRMSELVSRLAVDKVRMAENMQQSGGQLFSSQVLLLLVKKGLSREEAYKIVQECSHSLKKGDRLDKKLLAHTALKKIVKKSEIENLFKESGHKDRLKSVISRAMRV
jgi:adenylosuccinate lyase